MDAGRLQQESTKLAAFTENLKEIYRHLQNTIKYMMNPPVPLPIQSTAEELSMKSLPQQEAGERRETAGAQDKQHEASRKPTEVLQAQLTAEKEGLCYVSTLRQRCEELEMKFMDMADENVRLAEEMSHLIFVLEAKVRGRG